MNILKYIISQSTEPPKYQHHTTMQQGYTSQNYHTSLTNIIELILVSKIIPSLQHIPHITNKQEKHVHLLTAPLYITSTLRW